MDTIQVEDGLKEGLGPLETMCSGKGLSEF